MMFDIIVNRKGEKEKIYSAAVAKLWHSLRPTPSRIHPSVL